MPLRLITETLRNAIGPLTDVEVSFARVDPIPAAEGTYPPAMARVTSDGSGLISISLPVPASGGVRYSVGLPNAPAPIPIVVTDGAPTTLGALLVAALTTADPNDLQVLLDAHAAVKASPTVLGHIRLGSGLTIDSDGVVSVVGTGAAVISKTAGATLGGHRAVWIDASDLAQYADAGSGTAANVAGVTTGAASSGALATIQIGGELIEPTWAWSTGPVYVGSNGLLTQTPPSSGVLMAVGVATAPTHLVIRPHQPIYI